MKKDKGPIYDGGPEGRDGRSETYSLTALNEEVSKPWDERVNGFVEDCVTVD